MTYPDYRFIHGIEPVRKVARDLTVWATAGTLTPAQVRTAVLTIDEGVGDCNHYSVGGDWIFRNAAEFAAAIEDPLALFRSCNDIPFFMRYLLLHEAALMTIADFTARQGFIIEAYVTHGSVNNDWIQAALNVGLPPDSISAVIRLRLATRSLHSDEYALQHEMSDFLSFGDEKLGKRATCWGVMTVDDLLQTFLLCAGSLRKETRDSIPRLATINRLDLEQLQRIRVAAGG